MDPKPIYRGGGPALRNASRSVSGVNVDERGRKLKPETVM